MTLYFFDNCGNTALPSTGSWPNSTSSMTVCWSTASSPRHHLTLRTSVLAPWGWLTFGKPEPLNHNDVRPSQHNNPDGSEEYDTADFASTAEG
jgi:hypothetical protein